MSSKRQIPYHLHIGRAIFAALAVVGVSLLYLPSYSPVQKIQPTHTPESAVLAYATGINASDLATGTNNARAQNSLGSLSLSSTLSLSAQLKANDMIAKDYWAHVSPDGTQPWYWFGQAGYDYTNAGENLAYGFTTSDAVTAGWMNSPGHRANILGNYHDMGFGIANGENYQGGQNTVVVAHYGTARVVAAAPTAPAAPPAATTPVAPSTPAAPQAIAPQVPASPPSDAAPAPVAVVTPTAPPISNATPTEVPTAAAPSPKVSTPQYSTAVPVWQQIMHGTAPAIVLVSATILAFVSCGYIATHVSLAKHAAVLGERYVLHHPMVDASVAVGASLLMLITTIGRIS